MTWNENSERPFSEFSFAAEKDLQAFAPGELGITPVWFREYAEILKLIQKTE